MKKQTVNKEKKFDAVQIDLPLLIQQIHETAKKAGCPALAKPLTNWSDSLHDNAKNVSLIGTIEVQLLNDLLDQEILPPSIFPVGSSFEIAAGLEGEAPYYLRNEVRTPLVPAALSAYALDSQGNEIKAFIDSPWLRGNNIVLRVKQLIAADGLSLDDIFEFFSKTDIAVFGVDALTPLTKNELFWIKESVKRKVPAIIGLSRIVLVNEEERDGVKKYLNSYLGKYFDQGAMLEIDEKQLSVSSSTLQNTICEKLAAVNPDKQRLSFFLSRLHNYAVSLQNFIVERQQENDEQRDGNRQTAIEEKRRLDTKNDQWIALENVLVEKRQAVTQQLRDHLSKSREEILNNLLFEANRTSDAKVTWERDLPYFINRELQATAEKLSHAIYKQNEQTLTWLRDEIYRQFNYQVVLDPDLNVVIKNTGYQPEKLKLLDPQKWRSNSRYGAAAAVIGLGFLFISVPVGGVVVASSIIYQTAADQYISAAIKKDKKLISEKLKRVIEVSETAYVDEFSSKLKEAFDKLIAGLRENQSRWFDQQKEIIEMRTDDAPINASSERLADAFGQMEQVLNQLNKANQ